MGGHCVRLGLVWVHTLVFAKEMEDSDSRHSMWRAQAQARQLGGVQDQFAGELLGF